MRVALLHPVFWPEARRGAERLIHDLAVELLELGHEPTIITSHPVVVGPARVEGVAVVRVRRRSSQLAARLGYAEHLGHLGGLRRALSEADPHVVHSFYPTDALIGYRWAQRQNRASVMTVTGIPRLDVIRGRPMRERLWKRAAAGSGAVVAISNAAAADLAWIGRDLEVVEPGVRRDRFAPGGQRSPEPIVFCPADASDPRKRVAMLLEALPELRLGEPNAKLVLDRSAESALRGYIPKGAEEAVDFIDLDSDQRLQTAYQRAWVTALPAKREAFGLVMLESLACGTPAVGSGDAGIAEIIDSPEIGGTFDVDARGDLVESLLAAIEIARDPATAARCADRAASLSSRRSAERYLEIYDRCGGDSGSAAAPRSS